jgi:hypothetical protein
MSEPADESKVRTLATRTSAWWERARVSVLGLSILITVITTAYLAGQSLTEVSTKIDQTAHTVVEIREGLKGQGMSLANVSDRLSRLETSRDQQAENIRMFWARDWADLKHRVERIEQLILGTPTIKERP